MAPAPIITFAGIGLSLEGDPSSVACWQRLASAAALGAHDVRGAPLRCRLHALDTAARAGWSGLEWEWSAASGCVRTAQGEARVQRTSDAFVADVWVAPGSRAARLLLVGLTSLVLHVQGGLILHAASVVLRDEVIAFVGPSGAGKSTACGHVSGAVPFSVDRLALLPSSAPTARGAGGWLGHPLPGGSDPGLAGARWLPLRAVLRVQPSPTASRRETCPPALGVLLARESTFQLGRGAAAELATLGSLEQLVRDVDVGRLHVRLGSDLEPLLRAGSSRAREELR